MAPYPRHLNNDFFFLISYTLIVLNCIDCAFLFKNNITIKKCFIVAYARPRISHNSLPSQWSRHFTHIIFLELAHFMLGRKELKFKSLSFRLQFSLFHSLHYLVFFLNYVAFFFCIFLNCSLTYGYETTSEQFRRKQKRWSFRIWHRISPESTIPVRMLGPPSGLSSLSITNSATSVSLLPPHFHP